MSVAHRVIPVEDGVFLFLGGEGLPYLHNGVRVLVGSPPAIHRAGYPLDVVGRRPEPGAIVPELAAVEPLDGDRCTVGERSMAFEDHGGGRGGRIGVDGAFLVDGDVVDQNFVGPAITRHHDPVARDYVGGDILPTVARRWRSCRTVIDLQAPTLGRVLGCAAGGADLHPVAEDLDRHRISYRIAKSRDEVDVVGDGYVLAGPDSGTGG